MKRCVIPAYVNHLTNQNRKLKVYKWYTSRNFQEAEKFFDTGFPQVEEVMNYEPMGLKWYQGLVMPLGY